MTALGAVVLGRAYFSCRACRLGGYLVDRLLGPDGFLTRQATRLVCLLGGRHSLADAERLLAECRGWKLSDETIRRACQAEAAPMAASRADSPTVAAGDVEFRVDAVKVNTTGGWRDMEVGVFARRERGEPATPAEWDERELPAPTTRAATAAIETTDDFAPRWGEWADRLGIADRGAITVLGDGPNGSGRRRRGRTVVPDVQRSLEPVLGVSQLTT